MESSRFAASALAGSFVASKGTAALGFIIAFTPVGWVGIVVGGLVVVGCSVAVSVGVDNYLKNRAGKYHDNVKDWMSELWN